ncbi:MAG: rRNA maturation RNase YbeY [Treponema sp.]|jgi:probable rRNA maturation factor|nr:rRNA maturation RNase YbeY [Treponema sp.]
MNRVAVSAGELPLPPWSARVSSFALKVLEKLNRDRWDLSVLLCNNRLIRDLNARFRNRDEPTDVLSFPMGETLEDAGAGSRYLPGDIVISLETLAENARHFQVSEDEELRRLLVHGILHLDGLDHEGKLEPGTSPEETPETMLVLQERILSELSGERILL